MNPLHLTAHPGPAGSDAVVLRLQGDLDIASLDALTMAFERLASEGNCLVFADFSDVGFIGSPAVGVLMGARHRLRECGGDLALVGLGEGLAEKLSLMGANRVFHFYPDAVSAWRGWQWDTQGRSDRITLELPARPSYVPPLRRIVAGVLRQKGCSGKETFRFETIVDELANNAIEHGDPEQKKFYIELELSSRKVEISVRNAHRPMEPAALAKVQGKFANPVVDDESIRGRGLALVKMLADHVELQIDGQTTLVKATKQREE